MKLDLECVRDILLLIEAKRNFSVNEAGCVELDPISMHEIWKALPDRDNADIAYSLELLDEAGFIDMSTLDADGAMVEAFISRLTFQGHEYLETIRPETVWKKTTSVLSKIGSFSLDLVKDVASSILSDMAKGFLGIGQ
jgi:hypothetical protein